MSNQTGTSGMNGNKATTDIHRCKTCGLVEYRTRTGKCRRCLRLLPPKVEFLIPPPEPQELRGDDRQLFEQWPNRATVENIGQRIRQLRESRGMTQSQLQVRSRVSRSNLSRIESGQITPNLRTLEGISEVLGVGLNRFFVPESYREVLEDPFIQGLQPFLRQLDWDQWQSVLKSITEPGAAKAESPSTECRVALTRIAGKLRVISLTPDGTYTFLDPNQNLHNILYVADSETLELANTIDEFERLINSSRAREADFQRFFERYPNFILTDEHKNAHPHVILQSDSGSRGPLIPDFVLEPLERPGLADLLDLKLPSAQVLVLKRSRLHYSAAVVEACAQLREYSAFFDEPRNRTAVHTKYGLTAYRPRLFVIIGRRPNVDPLEARRVSDDLPPRITIRTYDDLLQRMQSRLERLKGAVSVP